MLLEPTAQPKFVACSRRNSRQVELRFRKLDYRPDSILIAQGHDVIPTARIGRLQL